MIVACPGCCLGFLQMVRSQSKLRQVEEPEPASWAFPTWPQLSQTTFYPPILAVFSLSLSYFCLVCLLLSRLFIFLLLSNFSLNPNSILDLNCPKQLSILCSPKCSVLAVSISIILLSRWFTFFSNGGPCFSSLHSL